MKPALGLLLMTVLCALTLGAVWLLVHFAGIQGSVVWGALVAVTVGLWNHSAEQKREHRRRLANEKREQYMQFLDVLNARFPTGDAQASDMTPEEIVELRRWSLRLTMTGSDDVLRSWNRVRLIAVRGPSPDEHPLKAWGSLWLAMRRDCGHHDTALKESDMLASVVNDVHNTQLSSTRPSLHNATDQSRMSWPFRTATELGMHVVAGAAVAWWADAGGRWLGLALIGRA